MRVRLSWLSIVVLLFAFAAPAPLRMFDGRAGHDGRTSLHPAVPGSVEVTPDGGSLSVTAHATGYAATFTVKNTRTTPSTYSLSCGTTGQLSACDVEPLAVTLDPDEATEATVTFAPGNLSTSGNVLSVARTRWVQMPCASSTIRHGRTFKAQNGFVGRSILADAA